MRLIDCAAILLVAFLLTGCLQNSGGGQASADQSPGAVQPVVQVPSVFAGRQYVAGPQTYYCVQNILGAPSEWNCPTMVKPAACNAYTMPASFKIHADNFINVFGSYESATYDGHCGFSLDASGFSWTMNWKLGGCGDMATVSRDVAVFEFGPGCAVQYFDGGAI